MQTKKNVGIVIAGIIIIIIGAVIYLLIGSSISPKNIIISRISVSDKEITLKGEDIADSAIAYRGYETTYGNEALYIKIKGSLVGIIPFLPETASFDISIKNNFGKIKEIYIQGNTPSENVLIWPKK